MQGEITTPYLFDQTALGNFALALSENVGLEIRVNRTSENRGDTVFIYATGNSEFHSVTEKITNWINSQIAPEIRAMVGEPAKV